MLVDLVGCIPAAELPKLSKFSRFCAVALFGAALPAVSVGENGGGVVWAAEAEGLDIETSREITMGLERVFSWFGVDACDRGRRFASNACRVSG